MDLVNCAIEDDAIGEEVVPGASQAKLRQEGDAQDSQNLSKVKM